MNDEETGPLGVRCLANFVADIDGAPPRAYKVGTLAGLIQPEVRADGQVAVDMGKGGGGRLMASYHVSITSITFPSRLSRVHRVYHVYHVYHVY